VISKPQQRESLGPLGLSNYEKNISFNGKVFASKKSTPGFLNLTVASKFFLHVIIIQKYLNNDMLSED
jgi:hypothetical protein